MNQSDDTVAKLLKLAASNDIKGFTELIGHDPTSVDQVGQWSVLRKGSTKVVTENRTPLMVASMYGSVDVMKKILSLSRTDVNRSTGIDLTTALHCAASGESLKVIDAVKLLLEKGADPNKIDANGLRPMDMIIDSPKLPEMQNVLHEILKPTDVLRIKNARYYTDEFMMYSFKVMECSRSTLHNLEECPFAHIGENLCRRDPHKYPYSCVPCREFGKGTCRRGDLCGYAHGILECWLHPSQYRTRLCKYGMSCDRELCSFAHKQEELRNVGSPSYLKPRLAPSGDRTLNVQQPNVPTLLSPERNFQSSRLSDQSMFVPRNNMSNFNEFQSMSPQSIEAISPMRARGLNLAPEYQHQQPQVRNLSSQELGSQWGSSSWKPDWPVNKEELDMSCIQSSRSSDLSSLSLRNNLSVFNQLQQQQNMVSPFNMNFSPQNTTFGVQSMSPGSIEAISPMSGTRVQNVDLKNQHQRELKSLRSRELGSNSVDSWSGWGSLSGKQDWAVNTEEPNFSFFQSPWDETPHEVEGPVYDGDASSLKNERIQLDRCVAQEDGRGWQYRSNMVRKEEMEKKSNI
ncbi:Ankyrin repeat-containing protein [Artemisia annua]|uniref:Ankyrin repeat-containing protein n=1 Tax=Artemisia annua TaxID=35608 RepID=A0A2U1NPW7_ARTAN|nr:Ankyrin repeat-containing protein [Artemisia annua]